MVAPVFVTLDVGLVHDVEAIVVEHGVHFGLTGVVAGAYGVDIGLLHQGDVLNHSGHVDAAAAGGVGVLGVDTLEVYLLAVDVDAVVVVGNFDVAEAVLGGKGFFFGTISLELCQLYGVEVGRFGRPKLQVGKAVEGDIFYHSAVAIGCEGKVDALFGNLCANRIDKAHAHLLVGGFTLFVGHGQLHIHAAALVVAASIECAGDVVVSQVGLWCGKEVNIAVNAAHVPAVLAFEV